VSGLAIGARADLLGFSSDHPLLGGRSGPAQLDGLIFGQAKEVLKEVMVGGRWIVKNGQHEKEEAAAAYKALLGRLNLEEKLSI
jgi:formimidoylglutamate deiminase